MPWKTWKDVQGPQLVDASDVAFRHVAPDPKELASVQDASTSEVLHMMLGDRDEDEYLGRMPVGGMGDLSEFDLMPPLEVEMGPEYETYEDIFGSARLKRKMQRHREDVDGCDDVYGDSVPFSAPVERHFPRYVEALRKHSAADPASRVVRVDTDHTFGAFVADQAVKELERRLNELRAVVETHVSDHHGPRAPQIRKWDEIVGAAQLVEDLRGADSADDAASALPQVPVDVPDYALAHVKCWKDGDKIVCSLRFGTPDGSARVATMAAKPVADEAEVAGCALRHGVDPAVVLGALPELVDRACAKRLVRDVAGAALKAQRRVDVFGMTHEPVFLVNGSGATAPVAALMDLQQQADYGDAQAQHEVSVLEGAATSPMGRRTALPVLTEARARLARGRAPKKSVGGYLGKYLDMASHL